MVHFQIHQDQQALNFPLSNANIKASSSIKPPLEVLIIPAQFSLNQFLLFPMTSLSSILGICREIKSEFFNTSSSEDVSIVKVFFSPL